jgi:hypothetical protein
VALLHVGSALAAAPKALPPKSFYGQYSRHFLGSMSWPAEVDFLAQSGFNFCIIGDRLEISPPPPAKWNFSAPVKIIDANGKGDRFIAESCNAIFIASTEEKRLSAILLAINDRPILTISPIIKFTSKGGMFGFVQVGETIRFTINRKALEAAGLRITDPKVLDLAVSEQED